jgi:beta-glucosidase
VLLGEVNPSGKLPFTFPRHLADKHAIGPLFPFGHGLSYTSFGYANLRWTSSDTAGGPITVSVDVSNTGSRTGLETVQLHVGDDATTAVVRPPKELRAFRRVKLDPGACATVRFTLTARDLSYYDVHRSAWVATSGLHRVLIGSSVSDIRVQQDFKWMNPGE